VLKDQFVSDRIANRVFRKISKPPIIALGKVKNMRNNMEIRLAGAQFAGVAGKKTAN
jgi:hypothetical protein